MLFLRVLSQLERVKPDILKPKLEDQTASGRNHSELSEGIKQKLDLLNVNGSAHQTHNNFCHKILRE
jgi:hypothetical protein